MRRLAVTGLLAAGAVALGGATATAAERVPAGELGNGLGLSTDPPPATGGFRITQRELAIRDGAGRVLVTVAAAAGEDVGEVRRRAVDAGLVPTATARGAGLVEGFVALTAVDRLTAVPGVASVAQSLRPVASVGAVTSQGVQQHRVDRLPRRFDGRGITVGALSDSFDAATQTVAGEPLTIRAADDVRTGDLPGPGNPRNAEPVVVLNDLEEGDGGIDEGRAMLQLIHDVAPGARQCFASAFLGFVAFAQNVRDLADPEGPCRADVVVDDVRYFDEPAFSESILTDAIDDIAAAGRHYYSSAGNAGEQQGWDDTLRLVPAAQAGGAAGVRLDQADPSLWDGGLHDFDPGPGRDLTQTVTVQGRGIFDLQWDDPYDPDGPVLGETPLLDVTGEITAADPVAEYPLEGLTGKTILVTADAIPSGSTDLVLRLRDPSGAVVAEIDTGTSPESLAATLTEPGTYVLEVLGFEGATGDFTLEVREVVSPSRTTTDLNLLFFAPDGRYLGSAADVNPLSGRAAEIISIAYAGRLQIAIARAGTGPTRVTRLVHFLFNGARFEEWWSPTEQATFGHTVARGATGVAAYDPFRPAYPESFTSPGGELTLLYDSDGNPLPATEQRRVPQIAATDGGNTTFFASDTNRDPDAFPNFFGTSAAAPHAAGIAALVLQAAGGPGSLSPDAMRERLQASAFPHDLDPFFSSGAADGLMVTARGEEGSERAGVPGSMDDRGFFTVAYDGPGSVRTLTLDLSTANPAGLGDGLLFDARPFGAPPFGDDGFPFTVASTSGGLQPYDVSASLGGTPRGLGAEGQFPRLRLRFARERFARGASLSFGIDRDEAISAFGTASEGNLADLLGGGTLIPEGTVLPLGATIEAQLTGGRALRAQMRNRIGAGWSPVDGYGFVNAERAVLGR